MSKKEKHEVKLGDVFVENVPSTAGAPRHLQVVEVVGARATLTVLNRQEGSPRYVKIQLKRLGSTAKKNYAFLENRTVQARIPDGSKLESFAPAQGVTS